MTYVSRGLAIAFLVALTGCQQSSTSTSESSSAATSSGGSSASSSQPASSTPSAATSSATTGSAPVVTASGLKIEDLVVGTGATAEKGKTVSVHYTGWLIDKSKADPFDSSVGRGQPYEFALGTGAVIRGWDEGVQGMKVGGKRLLTVPPDLGYGAQGNGPIPPNSTLIFEVELLDVR